MVKGVNLKALEGGAYSSPGTYGAQYRDDLCTQGFAGSDMLKLSFCLIKGKFGMIKEDKGFGSLP
jgi:hypothetical protein